MHVSAGRSLCLVVDILFVPSVLVSLCLFFRIEYTGSRAWLTKVKEIIEYVNFNVHVILIVTVNCFSSTAHVWPIIYTVLFKKDPC